MALIGPVEESREMDALSDLTRYIEIDRLINIYVYIYIY